MWAHVFLILVGKLDISGKEAALFASLDILLLNPEISQKASLRFISCF